MWAVERNTFVHLFLFSCNNEHFVYTLNMLKMNCICFVIVLVSLDTLTEGYHDPCSTEVHQQDMVFLPTSHHNRVRKAVTSLKKRVWEHGIIPYKISTDFTGSEVITIKKAIKQWERKTCISFQPKTNQSEYVFFQKQGNCGCCSFVGKIGGGQGVNLDSVCLTFGTVLHEIGHVIGFWHEHTRPDRDNYIQIFPRNIVKGQLKNFEKKLKKQIDSLGVPYDFSSLMHYSEKTFAKNSYGVSLQPKKPYKGILGQRLKISELDVLQAKLLYKCPVCGKTLADRNGEIEYSSNDGKRIHCRWRVVLSAGQRILLKFNKIQFSSPSCNHSYLEVRPGGKLATPIIFCHGNAPPPIFKVQTNELEIIFHNDVANTPAAILNIKYQDLCGGRLTTNSGVIESPNFPENYEEGDMCEWFIELEKPKRIIFEIDVLKVKKSRNCNKDYIEIIDPTNGKSMGKFCRLRQVLKDLVTSGNQAIVRFHSTSRKVRSGFSLRFQAEVNECLVNNGNCSHLCHDMIGRYNCSCLHGYQLHSDGRKCEKNCNQLMNIVPGQQIMLNSPSFPSGYPHHSNCQWKFIGTPTYNISIRFLVFNLTEVTGTSECSTSDKLSVYGGIDDKRQLLHNLCGTRKNDTLEILVPYKEMTITFQSDGIGNSKGFLLSIQQEKNECHENNGGCSHICENTRTSYQCHCHFGYKLSRNNHTCIPGNCEKNIRGTNGWILSPDFPEKYTGGNGCVWNLQSVPGQRFLLKFQHADVAFQNSLVCPFKINGKEICSDVLVPKSVYLTDHHIARLESNPNHHQKHPIFSIYYQSQCGGYLHATKEWQSIYSHPRYKAGQKYDANVDCSWAIKSKGRKRRVFIEFVTFNLESAPCNFDFVELYDGETKKSPMIAKKCGGAMKGKTFYSTGKSLLIRFKTDQNVHRRGFHMRYKRIKMEDISPPSSPTTVAPIYGRRRDYFVFNVDDD